MYLMIAIALILGFILKGLFGSNLVEGTPETDAADKAVADAVKKAAADAAKKAAADKAAADKAVADAAKKADAAAAKKAADAKTCKTGGTDGAAYACTGAGKVLDPAHSGTPCPPVGCDDTTCCEDASPADKTCKTGGADGAAFVCSAGKVIDPTHSDKKCLPKGCDDATCCVDESYNCARPSSPGGGIGGCTDPQDGSGHFQTRQDCYDSEECKSKPWPDCNYGTETTNKSIHSAVKQLTPYDKTCKCNPSSVNTRRGETCRHRTNYGKNRNMCPPSGLCPASGEVMPFGHRR